MQTFNIGKDSQGKMSISEEHLKIIQDSPCPFELEIVDIGQPNTFRDYSEPFMVDSNDLASMLKLVEMLNMFVANRILEDLIYIDELDNPENDYYVASIESTDNENEWLIVYGEANSGYETSITIQLNKGEL